MLLIPLPSLLLDNLMVLILGTTFIFLFRSIFSEKSIDFSLLPTVLLVLTLFSLFIQLSFTRLILTQVDLLNGGIIWAISFHAFSMNGSVGLVVSFLLFFTAYTVLMAQVVVKSTTRIMEVAAMVTLDSLPGKQTAIDEEYYVLGIINDEEFSVKRANLQRESDFFGALYGAGKFIFNNFKTSIFITVVSIIAGVIIGHFLHGETIETALGTYVPLSIANGVFVQFLVFLKCMIIGASVLNASSDFSSKKLTDASTQEMPEDPDPLALEIGYGLIPLVDKNHGAKLLTQLQDMHQKLIEELGIVIPKIRILDNMLLQNNEYCIRVHGKEAGKGTILQVCKDKDISEDSVSVIIRHFTEIIERNAAEISGKNS